MTSVRLLALAATTTLGCALAACGGDPSAPQTPSAADLGGRACPLGVCRDGRCPAECAYDEANVCGGDQTRWCANGYCAACAAGRLNCDRSGGCECQVSKEYKTGTVLGHCDGAQCVKQ